MSKIDFIRRYGPKIAETCTAVIGKRSIYLRSVWTRSTVRMSFDSRETRDTCIAELRRASVVIQSIEEVLT